MDNFSILEIATLFVVFISFLFAFFLFTVKTKNKLSNQLIGWYFIVLAIHISVFFYGFHFRIPLALDALRDHIAFLSSPLLYLYLLSAIYSNFQLRRKHLLHLIPFLTIILVFFPRFYGVSEAERLIFSNNYLSNPEAVFASLFGYAVALFYIVLMFIALARYKKILLENYSNANNFNFKWLRQLTILVSLLLVVGMFKNAYKYLGTDVDILNALRTLITLNLLGYLCWIVLKSMYHPELFSSIHSDQQLVKNILQEQAQPTKQANPVNANKNDVLLEQIRRLQNFMQQEQPYLNPSLTIKELARQLNMSTTDLSILINHHLNQHFFDFVNKYRIEKAMEILRKNEDKKLTILEILYQVGFNSKSSFNTAFKKHAGQTPSQYRISHS